jgi:hypothetical protein
MEEIMETIRDVWNFIRFGKQAIIHDFTNTLKEEFEISSFDINDWGSIYVYGHYHTARVYENGQIVTEFTCNNEAIPNTVEEFMEMKQMLEADKVKTEAAARYVINVLGFNKEDQ